MKKFYIETYCRKSKKWKCGWWGYKLLADAVKAGGRKPDCRIIFK